MFPYYSQIRLKESATTIHYILLTFKFPIPYCNDAVVLVVSREKSFVQVSEDDSPHSHDA